MQQYDESHAKRFGRFALHDSKSLKTRRPLPEHCQNHRINKVSRTILYGKRPPIKRFIIEIKNENINR